jgi:ABC-type multidrug transport system ATPase subunit
MTDDPMHPADHNDKTSNHQPAAGIQISVQGLGKRFNREWIFRGLNYTFTAGKTYAITGPNGSGKSTFLQVLWGQLPPSAGSFQYKKDHHTEISHEDLYQCITIATPYMDLIDELTLQEQLNFHFRLKHSRAGISQEEMLDKMYLRHARHKHISNLSSGMRQRVKLALAFFTQADVVFLDEPGTNLDKQAFEWYRRQLSELPDTSLVFIASNNPDEYPANTQIINILDYK